MEFVAAERRMDDDGLQIGLKKKAGSLQSAIWCLLPILFLLELVLGRAAG
jgi:hypothetical protein